MSNASGASAHLINRLSMPLLAVVGGAAMAKEGVDAFKVVRRAVHDFLIAHPASQTNRDR
jgi:hypothetical protein